MGLIERLLKTSTINEADILSKSKFFGEEEFVQTLVPMVNIAFSGRVDGGITCGLTQFAGPSKHFKTAFLMLCIRSYFDKYPESVCIFYDSEFGAPQAYFEMFGVDMTRVIHCPITDVEQFKFDAMKQLNGLEKGDRVFFALDSLGNLASKKEIEDAINEKSVADMTRAKQIKSVFRMVTPHLNLKNIPMVVVNHSYLSQDGNNKQIVSSGTGVYLSSDNIFVIGRQQDTDKATKELLGYNFIINVEKSRFVKEKSKLTIETSYEYGINPWSGLLDEALESGHVLNPVQGWYNFPDGKGKNFRKKDTDSAEFWLPILEDSKFREFIQNKYQLPKGSILHDISDDDVAEDMKNA